MSLLKVNLALAQKYDVAGPRYTSYPPATKFADAVVWPDLAERLLENNRVERDLSLYFHLPFCETLCWFCGCTAIITRRHSDSREYVDYLGKEVVQMGTLLNPGRQVVQLHWGGGSPTFLPPDEIRRLGQLIRQQFTLSKKLEASVEIDPRRLTREHLVALREVGFNHLSIGVQDFDPAVQRAVHRIQPREQTEQAVNWARELGFDSINFDLIYGLPLQTVDAFNRTLDAVLELNPDRLAVFSYAHAPRLKPAQRILERKLLPPPEVKLLLLKLVNQRLTEENRYLYLGLDHFARPNDEFARAQRRRQLQRNFQGYSTHAGADIYAFGLSGISQTPDAYWQNHQDLPSYYAALAAGKMPVGRSYLLTDEDKIRRETIMRLMCDMSLDFAAMSARLDLDFPAHFERELKALDGFVADGLVHRLPGGLLVTDTGRFFVRNIAMCFDNTLAPLGQREHSRTI